MIRRADRIPETALRKPTNVRIGQVTGSLRAIRPSHGLVVLELLVGGHRAEFYLLPETEVEVGAV